MEAHDMLQAAHDTIDQMLLETVVVVAGEEQGVEITDVMFSLTKQLRHAEADKGTIVTRLAKFNHVHTKIANFFRLCSIITYKLLVLTK